MAYYKKNSRMGKTLWLIKLMRPKQWVKNFFVLAPFVFAGQFLNKEAAISAFFALVVFCVASSAAYIVNDIWDIERDKKHRLKSKTRPLACGAVSLPSAVALLIVLYVVLILNFLVSPAVSLVVLAYLLLNFAYTFFLKNQPVLDIFSVAAGFVLRVYAGAVAINVPLSSWMFVTTLCLALYLAAIKRRQELTQNGGEGRAILSKYTVALVDRYAEMSATGALLFYSMFVMSSEPKLIISIPLVLFGLYRYWFVVEANDEGESPTDTLLADWQLLLVIFLWVSVCVWALWPTEG